MPVEAENVSFPFARQIIAIRRKVSGQKSKPDSDNTRYYVTSIAEGGDSPQRLMKKTREYWSVENLNHWRRDAGWREDKARTRDPNTGRVLTLLRC